MKRRPPETLRRRPAAEFAPPYTGAERERPTFSARHVTVRVRNADGSSRMIEADAGAVVEVDLARRTVRIDPA